MRPISIARLLVFATLATTSAHFLLAQAAYESDPKFAKQLKDAKAAEKQMDYLYAVDAYKKANKIAGGECVPCLQSAYDLDMKLTSYKDAVAVSGQMLALSSTPRDKSITKMNQAVAMLRLAGDSPKPDKLDPIHTLLQSAITDDPTNLGATFNDGAVLARMGRFDDASKQFTAYATQTSPDDPSQVRAQLFAKDPKLSLLPMAPPFTVTALDGSTVSLDAFHGKVVLIDFWATWNAPSREELANIRKIVDKYAGEPLVVLTVSWDQDDIGWKAYVAKNDMKWLQYRDADHKLTALFGVKWVPEYYIIDSNGVLLPGKLTDGSAVEGKLKPLLDRAIAAYKKNSAGDE